MKTNPIRPPLRPKKPGSTLPAQSPGLSQLARNLPVPIDRFLSNLNTIPWLPLADKAIIELMYVYGLRISEVLDIHLYDVMTSGLIRIRSKKGSRMRYVMPVYFISFWQVRDRNILPISNFYNRFYMYRVFKKLGYYSKHPGNTNFSVTHYFRHRCVSEMVQAGYTAHSISEFLGHRSAKTIQYYI